MQETIVANDDLSSFETGVAASPVACWAKADRTGRSSRSERRLVGEAGLEPAKS